MEKVISKIEIIMDGVYITENFKFENHVHEEYIKNLNCDKYTEEKIKISGDIYSENSNKNYLISLDLKEFLLRLFSLFGVNTRIESFYLDTDNDYKLLNHKIKPPIIKTDSSTILKQAEKVNRSLYVNERDDEFYNLIESNKDIDMIHRFRSLFSTFDKVAPKKRSSYHINYHALKKRYVDIIKSRYKSFEITRYQEITNELIKSNLIDNNTLENYSELLKEELSKLKKDIINDKVAFNLLKCIQIIRNKLNHGNFLGVTPKAIMGSYELLLPLTQDLMKDR